MGLDYLEGCTQAVYGGWPLLNDRGEVNYEWGWKPIRGMPGKEVRDDWLQLSHVDLSAEDQSASCLFPYPTESVVFVKYSFRYYRPRDVYTFRHFLSVKKTHFMDVLDGLWWPVLGAPWTEESSTVNVTKSPLNELEAIANFCSDPIPSQDFLEALLTGLVTGKRLVVTNIGEGTFMDLLKLLTICVPRGWRSKMAFIPVEVPSVKATTRFKLQFKNGSAGDREGPAIEVDFEGQRCKGKLPAICRPGEHVVATIARSVLGDLEALGSHNAAMAKLDNDIPRTEKEWADLLDAYEKAIRARKVAKIIDEILAAPEAVHEVNRDDLLDLLRIAPGSLEAAKKAKLDDLLSSHFRLCLVEALRGVRSKKARRGQTRLRRWLVELELAFLIVQDAFLRKWKRSVEPSPRVPSVSRQKAETGLKKTWTLVCRTPSRLGRFVRQQPWAAALIMLVLIFVIGWNRFPIRVGTDKNGATISPTAVVALEPTSATDSVPTKPPSGVWGGATPATGQLGKPATPRPTTPSPATPEPTAPLGPTPRPTMPPVATHQPTTPPKPDVTTPSLGSITQSPASSPTPTPTAAPTLPIVPVGSLAKPQMKLPQANAKNIGTTTTFTWEPVLGATSYRILVSSVPRAETTTAGGAKIDEPVNGTSYSNAFEPLLNGTKYYWTVVAIKKDERGQAVETWADDWSFTTVRKGGGF